ncbi:MAG TPA: hypothetical protein VE780_15045 [Thermoleophilaceae bacterium]|nr:hypothetical protein [Thermoleophilaceae bacterium]
MEVRRTLGGAAAGALAAGVWAAQQPLDKRVFGSDYDDVELLGKVVTRAPAWPVVGLFLHIQNGAVFGAAYAWLRPVLPGPPALRGALAGLAEHAGFWPLTRLLDRVHPARDELTPLAGNWRAFTQASWRHLLFGVLLGEIEVRVNPPLEPAEPGIPISSDGHGDIEHAAAAV